MPQIEELPIASRPQAPGWSYVPTTALHDPSKAAINPSGQKRRRTAATTTTAANAASSAADAAAVDATGLTLRQQAAVKRHLADLDRDSSREVAIAVPKSSRSGTGHKQSVNVRRVLGSGKTFAHYVEEEEAALAQQAGGARGVKGGGAAEIGAGPAKRKSLGGDGGKSGSGTPVPAVSKVGAETGAITGVVIHGKLEVQQPPPPSFAPGTILAQPEPASISEEEIEALLAAPQLSYNEARSRPPDDGGAAGGVRKRHRVFCEICGYWGRVRCIKCGARVCGIECKDAHDEGRCLKFYA